MINKLWSTEQPKESGFYWCKGANGKSTVAYMKRRGGTISIHDIGDELTNPLKWNGPIRFPSLYEANKVEKTLKELTKVE